MKRDIEESEQMFLVAWFECAWPDAFRCLVHCPNGGKRPINVARRMKRLGAKAGVSDLFLAVPLNGYAGLWIEYKPAPPARGVLSREQAAWLDLMRERGYRAEWVRGPDAFSDLVQAYLGTPPAISWREYFIRSAVGRSKKSFPYWLADRLSRPMDESRGV